MPALACAVSYPIAILGLLGTLVLLKILFRIEPEREAQQYAAEQRLKHEPLQRRSIVVDKPTMAGQTIDEICRRAGEGLAISRIRRAGHEEVQTALRDTSVEVGDTLLAVGTELPLERCELLLGKLASDDLMAAPGTITWRRIVVTNAKVLGKSPGELGLEGLHGIEVTRIARGDVEMTAAGNIRLQFGDILHIVGPEDQLEKAAAQLGNSLKKLNETQFIPLFFGIFLGVIAGSIPVLLPGFPHAVRLGLAGGPLVVALVLGRIGHLRGLVWHMPMTANLAFASLAWRSSSQRWVWQRAINSSRCCLARVVPAGLVLIF